VSLRIVLSASPAEARASTNPASTSVSKPTQFFRARRYPMLTQVTHQRQSQPAPLDFTRDRQLIILGEMISRGLRKAQRDSPAAG